MKIQVFDRSDLDPGPMTRRLADTVARACADALGAWYHGWVLSGRRGVERGER